MMMKNNVNFIFLYFFNFIKNEYFLFSNKENFIYVKMCIMLFLVLLIFNILGNFPYIFSYTSFISFTWMLGFLFWSSLVLVSLSNMFSSFSAHLSPLGSPLFLVNILVLLELVSLLLRPNTLGIRLSANISSGHILMALLGDFVMYSTSFFTYLFSIIVEIVILSMELGISMIQAYVFSTLVIMYSSEL
uniref:ATP synthase subunit a n=1 Tax=Gnathostomula armata TaxID=231613 RepID=A0A0F6Q2T8_9BILA|nr:ATP synthase F0 subunit 6 [Gnathostomula armata]AKD00022.1 ATP synthase F0 subunit 6 [Gnathostomula armata]